MHYLRNIEIRIKTKIKQAGGLTEIAKLKFRSKRNHQLNHDRPDLRQPGMSVSHQPPVLLVSKVILDVARCYLWLFTLYINIKIGKNSC